MQLAEVNSRSGDHPRGPLVEDGDEDDQSPIPDRTTTPDTDMGAAPNPGAGSDLLDLETAEHEERNLAKERAEADAFPERGVMDGFESAELPLSVNILHLDDCDDSADSSSESVVRNDLADARGSTSSDGGHYTTVTASTTYSRGRLRSILWDHTETQLFSQTYSGRAGQGIRMYVTRPRLTRR